MPLLERVNARQAKTNKERQTDPAPLEPTPKYEYKYIYVQLMGPANTSPHTILRPVVRDQQGSDGRCRPFPYSVHTPFSTLLFSIHLKNVIITV